MFSSVAMPLWAFIIVIGFTIAGIHHYLITPTLQWLIRSREKRMNEKLSHTLSRKLPKAFQIRRKTRVELFLNKPSVKQLIEAAIQAEPEREADIRKQARAYADEMTPGFFALFYFHIGFYMARTYLRLLYDIRVARQPSEAIKNIPEGASVVLVGNHRSNVDVMLLAYLSSRTSMISFAAGEWARAKPMSSILHMCGSYIIRRDASDPLYRKMLALHLEGMVEQKMPQGIFLEGGLTRDGSIQDIKLGLMNYILKGLNHQSVDDVVFVPVSFNYDQVPEDRTLLKHQDCGFEDKSQFYSLLSTGVYVCKLCTKAIRLGKTAYGKAAVSFGEPISMREWLAENELDGDAKQQHRTMVNTVGHQVMDNIADIIPVLPVSIVSTVLVEAQGKALTELAIKGRAASVIQRFRAQGALLVFEEGEEVAAVEEGLSILKTRRVLKQEGQTYHLNTPNQDLLHYYYNTVSHLLAEHVIDIPEQTVEASNDFIMPSVFDLEEAPMLSK